MIQRMHGGDHYSSAGHGDGYYFRISYHLRRNIGPIVQAVVEDEMKRLRKLVISCLTKHDCS